MRRTGTGCKFFSYWHCSPGTSNVWLLFSFNVWLEIKAFEIVLLNSWFQRGVSGISDGGHDRASNDGI